MQNYYTSIEVEKDGFIGVLYEKNTNRVLHKTQKYYSQSQAVKDVNNYIVSQQSVTDQAATLNTIKMQPSPFGGPKRCCGR